MNVIYVCDCCRLVPANVNFHNANLCFECLTKHYPINPVSLIDGLMAACDAAVKETSIENLVTKRDALANQYKDVCRLYMKIPESERMAKLDEIADKVANIDIEIRRREKEQGK